MESPVSIPFSGNKEFLSLVERRLAEVELDYADKFLALKKQKREGAENLLAGTLVLLTGRTDKTAHNDTTELQIILIKRSGRVSQAGDLSCPGGMLSPVIDRLIALAVGSGMTSILRGAPREALKKRDPLTRNLTTLFLSNALRETWEEIGLPPWRCRFLGALPTYSLRLFARTIFPIVAVSEKPFLFRPNPEVAKIVPIPVRALLERQNYGQLRLETDGGGTTTGTPQAYPCFFHREGDTEEILWGATYQIVTSFIELCFGKPGAIAADGPTATKTIGRDYLGDHNHKARY